MLVLNSQTNFVSRIMEVIDMLSCHRKLKLLACNSNPDLANEISIHLDIPCIDATIGRFSDGEIRVQIDESIRGADVFVIQSLSSPVHENIMELLLVVDGLKRASVRSITAVIPYYAYARQDRKSQPREPIAAKLLANLCQAAGIDRILTMDLHAPQIQGFFDIPVDNLEGVTILAEHLRSRNLEGCVVVSPDVGGVRRARGLAERLGASLAIIDKRRPQPNVAEIMNIIGDVSGKKCVLIDDMIDTAGTITQGASALIKCGATEVLACCTHGVLSGPAIERLDSSVIKEVVITNTIPGYTHGSSPKIATLSVGTLFAEAIMRIHEERSVSTLFN